MKFRYLKNVTTLQLDRSKCNGCGMCTVVCPQEVFTIIEGLSAVTDRDACMECSACAKNCPVEAISVRQGVGCAYAIIMDKFNLKSKCCADGCGCSLDDIPGYKQ